MAEGLPPPTRVGFVGLGNVAKDLGIAAAFAEQMDLEAPFLAHCRELWPAAEGALGRATDHTEVGRLWKGWNGFELGAGG